jgi:hypothetical protein
MRHWTRVPDFRSVSVSVDQAEREFFMPEKDSVAPSATSAGLVLHRVGFVTNTALQGAVAGALLGVTVAHLAVYFAQWLLPARTFDGFTWAILIVVGLAVAELLGALGGGSFGTAAGLRASRWGGKPLPSIRAAVPGAVVTVVLNVAGCCLAAGLFATMAGLNTELEWWHFVILAAPCALLGLAIGSYVGLADPLPWRGVVLAGVGAVAGGLPAIGAAYLLVATPIGAGIAWRNAIGCALVMGGLIGGWLAGQLMEMFRRQAN